MQMASTICEVDLFLLSFERGQLRRKSAQASPRAVLRPFHPKRFLVDRNCRSRPARVQQKSYEERGSCVRDEERVLSAGLMSPDARIVAQRIRSKKRRM